MYPSSTRAITPRDQDHALYTWTADPGIQTLDPRIEDQKNLSLCSQREKEDTWFYWRVPRTEVIRGQPSSVPPICAFIQTWKNLFKVLRPKPCPGRPLSALTLQGGAENKLQKVAKSLSD